MNWFKFLQKDSRRLPASEADFIPAASSIKAKWRSAYHKALKAHSLGHSTEALKNIESAIALGGKESVDVLHSQGVILFAIGRKEDAIASWKQALLIDPNHIEAQFGIGSTLSDFGQYNEAIAILKKLTLQKEEYFKAWNSLGYAYRQLGRIDQARSCYLRTLQLNPDSKVAIGGLRLLESANVLTKHAHRLEGDFATNRSSSESRSCPWENMMRNDATDYFNKKYKTGRDNIEQLKQRKTYSNISNKLKIAKDSQAFCDFISYSIKNLLHQNEKNVLRDYYYGLTSELLISSSIEKIGNSHLILIHRRLFSACQFLSDTLCSSIIPEDIKLLNLGEYIYKIAKNIPYPAELPNPPKFLNETELTYSTAFNCGLVRFILCHELYHVLPIDTFYGLDIQKELSKQYNISNASWTKEISSDLFGCCLPLRENRIDGKIHEAFFQVSISSALLFCFFYGYC